MNTGEVETLDPSAPPQIIGKIETDLFCAHCHYNMHGLDVLRDARLDMPIIRCPECGKFHPAGMATGAGRIWLSRLAFFLITFWVLFLGAGILILGFGFFCTDMISVEAFTTYRQFNQMVAPGAPMPPGGWDYRRVPYTAQNAEQAREIFYMNVMLFGSTFILAWLLGAGGAVFLWHRKRYWLLALLIIPFLAVTFPAIIFSEERTRFAPETPAWIVMRLLTMTLFQCASILVGIWIGRAITRGVLSVILTRKLLQHVRFLWTVDNKVPPGMD